MTIGDLETLVLDLAELSDETEWVEFKENYAVPDEIGEYISALSNSAALLGKSRGYLVWGIQNVSHEIVGTTFRPAGHKIGGEDLEPWLSRLLAPRVDFRFHDGEVNGKSVVVLEVPAASHTPIRFKNEEYVRVGSYKKKLREHPEKERALWANFARTPYEQAIALEGVDSGDIAELLDYPAYFSLLDLPIPSEYTGVLARLEEEKFIVPSGRGRYDITNLGAIAFAKDLRRLGIERKAVRVIIYKGANRIETLREREGRFGYAASFKRLMDFINSQLPTNEHIGRALRQVRPMYPEVALRELVANALIHQDFYLTGTGPMVEVFADRVEITNPGVPLVDPKRFIDATPVSRNEAFASLMRRFNICEERGSGVDKVIFAAEVFQLPAPDFRVADLHTKAVLFAPRPLSAMSRQDRVRACYQHACLQFVSGNQMTNASLRERFKLPAKQHPVASRIIRDALEADLIKPYDPSNTSNKHAKYVPFWG